MKRTTSLIAAATVAAFFLASCANGIGDGVTSTDSSADATASDTIQITGGMA